MIALMLVAGIFAAALLAGYLVCLAGDVVRAAITNALYRREDVRLARSREVPGSLTVPSRLDPAIAQALAQARLNRHQEYDTAAMDRMVDDVERGAS